MKQAFMILFNKSNIENCKTKLNIVLVQLLIDLIKHNDGRHAGVLYKLITVDGFKGRLG